MSYHVLERVDIVTRMGNRLCNAVNTASASPTIGRNKRAVCSAAQNLREEIVARANGLSSMAAWLDRDGSRLRTLSVHSLVHIFLARYEKMQLVATATFYSSVR